MINWMLEQSLTSWSGIMDKFIMSIVAIAVITQLGTEIVILLIEDAREIRAAWRGEADATLEDDKD